MGYRNRLPNDCRWVLSYKGRDVSGLRILLYLVSDAYTLMYEKDSCSFEMDYARIRRNIPQLRNKTCGFLSVCMDTALKNAVTYDETIATVKTHENSTYIKYTDCMFETVSKRISHDYFTFMFGDILKLPTVNSIKMYILYRKYYNIITYMKFRDSEITEIFGNNINMRKNMYRAVRTANDHIGNIGIRYRLEKCGNIWKFVSA